MDKYKLSLFIAVLFVFLFACTSESKKEKEPELSEREMLYKEVMEIHDAVMPKMSDINRVKRKLKDHLEEDAINDDSLKSKMNANIDELIAAENSMMDWMKDFKAPKKDDPDQQVIDYLNEEKIKISRVSDQMLSSLENSTKLMDQLTVSKAYHSENK